MFVGNQILKESTVYTVTELDPIFILLPPLYQSTVIKGSESKDQQQQYRSFAQIFDSLSIELDEEDEILAALDDSPESAEKTGDKASKAETFGDALKSSACLERALSRICETKSSADSTDG